MASSAASFQDLGLREALLLPLEDADIEAPTDVQRATIPVLRRGGNVFARAGSGSGKTLAYALGVLDRLQLEEREEDAADDEPTTRVLVLRPGAEAAERTAVALVPFAHAIGGTVAVLGAAWGGSGAAEVLVATPAAAAAAVRSSALKLGALESIVVDGASDMLALGADEALEALLDHTPRDAQRVVFSVVADGATGELVERRAKRALGYPAEPPDAGGEAPTAGPVGYAVVSEGERFDALMRLLTDRAERATPVVFTRSDERAAELAEALSLRGLMIGGAEDADSDAAVASAAAALADFADSTGDAAVRSISMDVPADPQTLLARHAGDSDAVVLVAPRELAHLLEIAQRARLAPHPVTLPAPAEGGEPGLAPFRDALRQAVQEEDTGAQMLVLEPLFAEFGAARVAAAAAALLRRRPAAQRAQVGAAEQTPAEASRPPGGAEPEAPKAPAGAPPTPYVRLFISVGKRDGARAGDLVGAIAGESGIPGSKIGRIEIRDTFSIVEVEADVAERVVRAVNGTTIKGRAARVDYDRDRVAPPRPSGARRLRPDRRPREAQ